MDNPLFRADQVAARLNISRSQAFSLMRNGELPTVRFGRLVRVREEDLEAFITRNLTQNEPTLKTKLAAATASLDEH